MGAGGEPVHDEEEVVDREREAWKRRPFARSFDLIAEQYGWTDDQILDLTMQRMSQIRSVIWERQAEARKKDLKVREYELRTLANYIAASAGNKAGVKNVGKIQLVADDPEEPKKIRYVPFEQAQRWFPDG